MIVDEETLKQIMDEDSVVQKYKQMIENGNLENHEEEYKKELDKLTWNEPLVDPLEKETDDEYFARLKRHEQVNKNQKASEVISNDLKNAVKTDPIAQGYLKMNADKLIFAQTGDIGKFNIPDNIQFRFNEDKFINELMVYVKATYSQHYAGKYQATDMIIDSGHGTGFCIGNIMKLAKRYGKKEGYNIKDLMKIMHYVLIQLYIQDNNLQ